MADFDQINLIVGRKPDTNFLCARFYPYSLFLIPGSNGFCGFRYDPQMNADERRQTLTACAGGQSAGASAFIRGLQGSQLSEILCSHKNPLESALFFILCAFVWDIGVMTC